MAEDCQIIKILSVMTLAYPKFELKPDTLEVYILMLRDLDPVVLDQAAKICMATKTFFPAVAEIRAAAAEVTARANHLPSAGEAWGEITDKIKTHGNTMTGKEYPTFSNPVVERVVKFMGWNNLCLSENEIADRARFLQIYEAEERRTREDMQYLPETHQQIEKLAAVNDNIKRLAAGMSVK
jgi:hypothetical protein